MFYEKICLVFIKGLNIQDDCQFGNKIVHGTTSIDMPFLLALYLKKKKKINSFCLLYMSL